MRAEQVPGSLNRCFSIGLWRAAGALRFLAWGQRHAFCEFFAVKSNRYTSYNIEGRKEGKWRGTEGEREGGGRRRRSEAKKKRKKGMKRREKTKNRESPEKEKKNACWGFFLMSPY